MSNRQRKKRLRRNRQPNQNSIRSADAPVADQVMTRSELTARSYHVRVDTLDENKRSVEAVIATEAPVLVMDLARWEVVEEILLMSGARFPASNQVPMLDSHDRSSVQKQLGSTRNLRIEGTQLIGLNVFSNSTEAEHAWQLTREGHLNDNSIGYRAENFVTIEAGKSAEIEGRQFTASANRALRVTTEWAVKENSVCPVGADAAAKNRAAETAAETNTNVNIESSNKRKDTAMEFTKWLSDRGFVEADLNETQRASMQTQFDAERTAADESAAAAAATTDQTGQREVTVATVIAQPTAADVAEAARAAVDAERKRCSDIRAAGNGLGIDNEVIERCIDDNSNIDQARTVFLEAVRSARPDGVGSPAIIVRGGGQMTGQLIEDAIMLRAGFEDVVLKEKEGEQRADRANGFRDMSLMDIARYAITMDGDQIPTGREAIITRAFSTMNLPTIFGAIYNKSLLRGYEAKEQSWRNWCNIGSAPDFKTMTRVRLTDSGGFEKLGGGGEIAKGEKAEEKEEFSVETFAKMDQITRVQMINDDLNVLTRTPFRMGVNGNMVIGEQVYTHFLGNPTMDDGVALFHADHNNLNASAALTETNLQLALAKFRKQTDKMGKPIKVAPEVLIVPVELWFTARKLLESAVILITGDSDATAGSKNVLQGALKAVQDEALSNATYTGYSTTSWYLTGDPATSDTVEVAFLNGVQTPTVRTFANIMGVLGIAIDAFIDFGVKALDHRTVQKNNA